MSNLIARLAQLWMHCKATKATKGAAYNLASRFR